MPRYSYLCNNCQLTFEVVRSRSNYKEREKCPGCASKNGVQRNFKADIPLGFIHVGTGGAKTLGHLADLRGDRTSEDEKLALWKKHNEYRWAEGEKPLPDGLKRMRDITKPPEKLPNYAPKTRRKLVRKGGKNVQ